MFLGKYFSAKLQNFRKTKTIFIQPWARYSCFFSAFAFQRISNLEIFSYEVGWCVFSPVPNFFVPEFGQVDEHLHGLWASHIFTKILSGI